MSRNRWLPSDAVNRLRLDIRLIINSVGSLSFNGFRLSKAGKPIDEKDVIDVQYMKDDTIVLNNDGFDAVIRFIQRLKFPENQSDAAKKYKLIKTSRTGFGFWFTK